MSRILIVEDHVKDLSIAAEAARAAGFSEIEARPDIRSTEVYLEKALGGDGSLPDVILLDLDLGHESGYEILRIRYGNTRLARIPVVIWTQLGRENYEVCALFNIKGYVAKWEGPEALREALIRLVLEVSKE